MSKQGLELQGNLSEIRNAGVAIDNLCIGPAEPFDSNDFRVFASNKRNVSFFTYIPNNFTTSLSSLGGVINTFRLSIIKTRNVDSSVINCDISEGDIIYGEGLQPNTVIERIDTIFNIFNVFNLPTTELVLSKPLTATIPVFSLFTLKKQNNASIQDNEFILGRDTKYVYYTNDIIKSIYYPLSTSTNSILSTDSTDLYIVDAKLNENNQFCFGLSLTPSGEKINLSFVNSLCAINLERGNEVTSINFRNIFLPENIEGPIEDSYRDNSRSYYSMLRTSQLSGAFDTIASRVGQTQATLIDKVRCNANNITNKDINISGVVKIADPDKINGATISNDSNAPSIYILNTATGNLDDKQRIFSGFGSPWVTTADSLSTNKNLFMGSLTFEEDVQLDQISVESIDPLPVAFTRKIPIDVTDKDGFISTYFLLASSQV
jgi:hypothetical protein